MSSAANSDAPSADELRAQQEQLRSRLNALKVAYLNGTEYAGNPVSYEDLKQAAQELIRANYALQKLLYGSVKLKLSVAKLLRHAG